MYLGDGHLVQYPRAYALRVFLNENRRDIIDRVKAAIVTLLPDNRVSVAGRRGAAVVIVTCYSTAWPILFPQHGPGRKHTRRIILEPWQRLIVERHPFEFLRGCLESDGCRHRRIVNGKNYPAYSFTNHSEDILTLFTSTCDAIGLRWRRANRVTISIARRADVARLDAFYADGLRSPLAVPLISPGANNLLT
jgi:hypothetical protein